MENQENNEQNTEKRTRGRPRTVQGVYDSKKYYQTFKLKNEDKIREKIQCPICGGLYSYYNKSHHTKSNIHKMATMKKELESLKEEMNLVVKVKPTNVVILEDE